MNHRLFAFYDMPFCAVHPIFTWLLKAESLTLPNKPINQLLMIFEIAHKQHYSRKELLLRSFFGFFYIVIPHVFLLIFASIAASMLQFISFWIILFTGRYPQSWFEFQVKFHSWNIRVNASILNLVDGYPEFGFNGKHDDITFEVPYPEQYSRVDILLRGLFGWIYVGLVHGIILMGLSIAAQLIVFIAWWIVLFTGQYPAELHSFMVGYLRWSQRVTLYLGYMSNTYPPFSFS